MDLRFFQLRPGTPAGVVRAPRHRLASPPVYQPGTLIATLQERDNGLLPQAIRCDADPTHEWSPGEWPALGRQLGTFVA